MTSNSFWKITDRDTLNLSDRRTDAFTEIIYKQVIIPANKINNQKWGETVYKKLEDLFSKAKAVGYHLSQIIWEIESKSNIETYKGNKDVFETFPKKHFENDVLVYEVEAFLFQVKCDLDILIQALIPVFPFLVEHKNCPNGDKESFRSESGVAGAGTINLLAKNGQTKLSTLFKTEVGDWIQELQDWRDTITHRSNLKGFFCYILKCDKNQNFSLEKPKMPSEKKVDEYCISIFNKMLNLDNKVIEYISEIK